MPTNYKESVVVNGQPQEFKGETLLTELLRQIDVDPRTAKGVAVAVNDEVVPREEWSDVRIKSGDRVEVVTAKQGG